MLTIDTIPDCAENIVFLSVFYPEKYLKMLTIVTKLRHAEIEGSVIYFIYIERFIIRGFRYG